MLLFKFKQPMKPSDLDMQPIKYEQNIPKAVVNRKNKKTKHNQQPTRQIMNVYLDGSWYISEKHEGLHSVWTGKHLLDVNTMMPIQNIPSWFLESFKTIRVPLDGILLNYDIEDPLPIDWRQITYMVFDIPIPSIAFENRLVRMKELKVFRQIPKPKHIKLVEFTLIKNIKNNFCDVSKRYHEIVTNGGSGLMLMKMGSMYEPRTVSHFLQYNKEINGEAKIIGYKEGENKYYTHLGKYKCKTINGKIFYCSQDIPDDIRFKFHFCRTLCKRIDDIDNVPVIGDTLYYSSIKMIKSGMVPRLPRYKGFKKQTKQTEQTESK